MSNNNKHQSSVSIIILTISNNIQHKLTITDNNKLFLQICNSDNKYSIIAIFANNISISYNIFQYLIISFIIQKHITTIAYN